jgi:hypothetical protein
MSPFQLYKIKTLIYGHDLPKHNGWPNYTNPTILQTQHFLLIFFQQPKHIQNTSQSERCDDQAESPHLCFLLALCSKFR